MSNITLGFPETSITPPEQNIVLTIGGVEVFNSKDMKTNNSNDFKNTTNYELPLLEQESPFNIPIVDREYKHKNLQGIETKLGNFNGFKTKKIPNINPPEYILILLFDNGVYFKFKGVFGNYLNSKDKIEDFLNKDANLSKFLNQIYFFNKKSVSDSKLKNYNYENELKRKKIENQNLKEQRKEKYFKKILEMSGGRLSRKHIRKSKTNKKLKKNTKSKKTKFNRNKK